MWSSFLAVFRKEFLHVFRDKSTLRIALMVPVMQMLLFGFIDQTVHDLATVVVDQDRSVESRLLIDQMTASKTFKVTRLTSSPDVAREEIRAGRARVGVVIPPKFRDKKTKGREPAQVLVLIDGSDSTPASQALASINGLVAQDNLARAETVGSPPGIAAQPIILFNPEGRTANYIIPGLVAVILQLVAIILAAGAVVRERENGTMEQLLVTPINPLGLMLGKLGPYLILSLGEMTIALLLMRVVFMVPIRGNLLMLYGVSIIYLFSLLALGLLISSGSRTQMEAQQKGQMLFLPGVFLSGYIFPFEGLPAILKGIGLCFPVTHMIAIMRGVVLRNANAIDMWPHIAALVGMSVVLVFLGARSIRKVA
jgi:ABC-2 type transport system permease protein